MEERTKLYQNLCLHDWYHMYSDDHRVWQRGSNDARKLQKELEEVGCPFKWWDIHKALSGFILEDYVEVNPGEYRNPNWKHDCIASQKREDLLTRAEAEEILAWFGKAKAERPEESTSE